MKQHITTEQWDELEQEQKVQLYLATPIRSVGVNKEKNIIEGEIATPNIGQMIEFLDCDEMALFEDGWVLEYLRKDKHTGSHHNTQILCDALWEAVKTKLQKATKT